MLAMPDARSAAEKAAFAQPMPTVSPGAEKVATKYGGARLLPAIAFLQAKTHITLDDLLTVGAGKMLARIDQAPIVFQLLAGPDDKADVRQYDVALHKESIKWVAVLIQMHRMALFEEKADAKVASGDKEVAMTEDELDRLHEQFETTYTVRLEENEIASLAACKRIQANGLKYKVGGGLQLAKLKLQTGAPLPCTTGDDSLACHTFARLRTPSHALLTPSRSQPQVRRSPSPRATTSPTLSS